MELITRFRTIGERVKFQLQNMYLLWKQMKKSNLGPKNGTFNKCKYENKYD